MKTRVLHKDGCYIPQMRPTAWPFWFNITDDIFERESEELDNYNTELSADDVAEGCARRLVGNQKDFVGEVYYRSWRQRVRNFFRGVPGPQGACGAMGMSGRDGKSRGALDLQCPNCKKFVQDEPVQEIRFRFWHTQAEPTFTLHCDGCRRCSVWKIVNGLPIPCSMLRKEEPDATSG